MRGWHRYVALTLVAVVSACSNGDGTADTPPSAATRPTLAPVVTASIAPTPAPATTTTAVAAPTTVVAVTTPTLPATPPTTTPAPDTSISAPDSTIAPCGPQPAAVCQGVTVPLPPDADVILERYRAFAQKHLEVQTTPDAPDWAGLQAYVVPEVRAEARSEVEDRFKRGEVLNVSLGVTLDPRLSRLRFPEGLIELLDCRTDGSYWMDQASGGLVAGEVAEVRRRPFRVAMEKVDGRWFVGEYRYVEGKC